MDQLSVTSWERMSLKKVIPGSLFINPMGITGVALMDLSGHSYRGTEYLNQGECFVFLRSFFLNDDPYEERAICLSCYGLGVIFMGSWLNDQILENSQ